jgi:ElaB/YqjD/DUF883 family membrane-anchored ribosome-binding protein
VQDFRDGGSGRVPFRAFLSLEQIMRTTREKLVDDFAEMLTEAEDLMKRAASETGERAKDLRTQVEAKLLAAKSRLQEMQGDALDSAKAAARVTDDYVHDNPWQAIGAAAALGFLVGLLMNRR